MCSKGMEGSCLPACLPAFVALYNALDASFVNGGMNATRQSYIRAHLRMAMDLDSTGLGPPKSQLSSLGRPVQSDALDFSSERHARFAFAAEMHSGTKAPAMTAKTLCC